MQNSLIIPQKIKHRVRYVLAFSFPAYTREILKTSTQSLCMNVPTNILLNSWQVETTQMSTNWWMNKQNVVYLFGFFTWLRGKESICNRGDPRDSGSIPESGRSPWGGHGNPLQCSFLKNPMDRGAWQATIQRVTKSWTGLSEWAPIVYLYHKIIFINKKKWSTYICHTINEAWKHYAKWKKIVKKRPHISWLHLYETSSMANLKRQSKLAVVLGYGVRRNGEQTWNFLGWWKCSKLKL